VSDGNASTASAPRRHWYSILYVQVPLAIAIGILIGHYFPSAGVALKPLGDGFISLIKMMIGPVIFCTVVHGIGSMRDLKKVGRVGVKTLLYFEAVAGSAGPPGPQGVQGPAGPPGPAAAIRIVRSNCIATTCTAECEPNEVLVSAYCGPNRLPASCGVVPSASNSPLVAVCAFPINIRQNINSFIVVLNYRDRAVA
jgi:hypothetical protein